MKRDRTLYDDVLEQHDEDHPSVLTEDEAQEIVGPLSDYALDVIVHGTGLTRGH